MKELFEKLLTAIWGENDSDVDEQQNRKGVAIAVLLVDIALVDNEFDPKEHEWVIKLLMSFLSLSRDRAYELLDKATDIVETNRDPEAYAVYLRDTIPATERESIVELLDEIVKADHDKDHFELRLRERYQELLGVKVSAN
mgnify:CR=1 FL=1